MDNKPPINLDEQAPDPVLDQMKGYSNVNQPGKTKRLHSMLIGLLVFLVLILIMGIAVYLMRDSMPEVISDYLDDINIPYLSR